MDGWPQDTGGHATAVAVDGHEVSGPTSPDQTASLGNTCPRPIEFAAVQLQLQLQLQLQAEVAVQFAASGQARS
ncbi:hypothetical protein OsI_31383 [Oryza sativa Indica Group]|uniref:Uncharacterized protein n=1 Tax=Oryza sativa subsp. indica TaxID=39946 RepID=B8BF92_ORYSI|nr:hypothetical protein OsI_31383 [Oryza sativa Indica Group]